MQLYAIKNMMIETLDIFLGSEQDNIDKDFYNETMDSAITLKPLPVSFGNLIIYC